MPHKTLESRLAYEKRYRKLNHEKLLAQSRARYQKNIKRFRKYGKTYRESNKQKITEYRRRWYEENKEDQRRWRQRYYRRNKSAMRAKSEEWKRNNPEQYKAIILRWKLRKRYNLSLEQHQQLRKSQHNMCAICSLRFSKTPHVDHCSITGTVRGLLCTNCNLGIGSLKHSTTILLNAITYLQRQITKNYTPWLKQ